MNILQLVKKILKLLLPPFIWILLRSLTKLLRRSFIITPNILPSFDPNIYYSLNEINQVHLVEQPWDNLNWIRHVQDSLDKACEVRNETVHHEMILNIISFCKALYPSMNINVFDIGGGTGLFYPVVREMFSDNWHNINWIVVDSTANIVIGKQKFIGDQQIIFCDSEKFKELSYDKQNSISILNISSTLHYILEWEKFLEQIISELNPQAVAITRVPTCIDATHQAYAIQHITTCYGYCGFTKVVLFSSGSIENKMNSLGFIRSSQPKIDHSISHFDHGCIDKSYEEMQCVAYSFIRRDYSFNSQSLLENT